MRAVSEIPLYQQIYETIKNNILDNSLKTGNKLPTEQELMDQYNVSRITVSRAMKELQDEGFVKRVRRAGTFVNDISEMTKKENVENPVIGVILPFGEAIGYEIIHGAQEKALQYNAMVTFYNTNDDIDMERSIIEKMLDMNIVGMSIYPCDGYGNLKLFSEMYLKKIPFVFLDRSVEGIPVPVVSSDNYQGMYEMTRYILETGHRRISFFCNSIVRRYAESERYKGFVRAMLEFGTAPDERYLVQHREFERPTDNPTIEDVLDRLMSMDDPPTAFVCSNDFNAVTVINILKQMGIQVPKDVSVTGFDNLIITKTHSTPVTTVEQPFTLMGEKAVEMLMNMIQYGGTGKNLQLPTKLVYRSSVQRPKN